MSSARSKTAVPYTESLRKRRVRKAGLVCFILYMGVLVYFLFFADWYEHGPGTHFAAGVNLVPFREIRRYIGMLRGGRSLKPFLNLVGNVVGFIPFGFFLPVMTRTFHSFIRVLFMGFLFSLGVELLQLFTKAGSFDVDDILLNTLGTALGYLLFILMDELFIAFRRRHGR